MSQMSFQDLSEDNQRRVRYFYDNRITINNDNELMMANAIYEYDRDMQMGQVRDDYYGISRDNVDRLKWFNENRFRIKSDEDLYQANRFYDRYNVGRLTGMKVDYRQAIKIPNYGTTWQDMGYDYDPDDYDDMQRQNLNLPPGAYINLYGNSKEDQARLIDGRAPIRMENTQRLMGDVEDLMRQATYKAQNGGLTRDEFDYILSGYESIGALDHYYEQMSVADINNQSFGVYGLDKKEVPNLFVDHIGEIYGEGWKDRLYEELVGYNPQKQEEMIEPKIKADTKGEIALRYLQMLYPMASPTGPLGAMKAQMDEIHRITDNILKKSGGKPKGAGAFVYNLMSSYREWLGGITTDIPLAFIKDQDIRNAYTNLTNPDVNPDEMLSDLTEKEQFWSSVGGAIGTALPTLLMTIGTGGAGLGIGSAVNGVMATTGLSTFGSGARQAYDDNIALGKEESLAHSNSLKKAAVDSIVTMALERLMGQEIKAGASIGKALFKEGTKDLGGQITKRVGLKVIKNLLKNMGEEILEEELESVSQNLTTKLFVDKDQRILPTFQEAWETAKVTAIVSALLGGGQVPSDYINIKTQNKIIAGSMALTSQTENLEGTVSQSMGLGILKDISENKEVDPTRFGEFKSQLEADLSAVEMPSYKEFKRSNERVDDQSISPMDNETPELPGGGGDDESEISTRLNKQPPVVQETYHAVKEEVGLLTAQQDELMDSLEATKAAIDEQLDNTSIDNELRTSLRRNSREVKELIAAVKESGLPENMISEIEDLAYYKYKKSPHEIMDLKTKYHDGILEVREKLARIQDQYIHHHNRFGYTDKTLNQIKELHKDKRERTRDAVDGVTRYWRNIALREVSKARFNELKRIITKTIPAKLSRYHQMPLQDGFREGMMALYESIGPITQGGIENDMNLSILSDFVNNNKELKDNDGDTLGQFAEMFGGLKGKKLSELNDDDVEIMTRLLKSMIHISNTMNKVRIQGRDVETRNVIRSINKLVSGNNLKVGKRLKSAAAQELFGFGAMDPEIVVRAIFGNNTKNIAYDAIYGELNHATHEESRLNVNDYFYFNKMLEGIKGAKHWSGRYAKRVSIDVETNSGQGQKLSLTKSEIIMLSLHARNEYNIAAMRKGLLFADDRSVKANGGKEAFSLNEKDIKKIVDMVNNDPEMKKVADGIYDWWNLETYTNQFGNEVAASKKRLNNTTMQLYGYKVATEENYVPLIRDKTLFQKVFTVLGSTLESYGFLKARNHVSDKPIMLLDVFSQVKHHAEATAKFATWAMPIKNLKRIMGHPEVRQVLNDNYGKVVENYFEDLINTADGNTLKQNALEGMLMKGQSQVKKAIVASPYIWINQLGSIPLAAAELNMKYFTKGINLVDGKGSVEKMIQYAPSLYARRFFGGDREIAEVMSEKSRVRKTLDKPSATVTRFDTMAIEFIWNWATAEVKGETKLSGEAFWKAVADKATQCVERTQPNATMMHRSKVGKTESSKLRTLLMFSTVPNKIYNMYISAYLDGKTGNKKRAAKYITAAIGSALWVALKNHMRAIARKEKETDAKTFLLDFGSSLVTPVYLVNKAVNFAKGRTMGLGGSPLEDVVADMGTALIDIFKEGASVQDFKKAAFAGGQLLGIPATQWERDVIKPILKECSWELYDAIYHEKSYTQDYAVAIQMGRDKDAKEIARIMAMRGKAPSFGGSSWYEKLTPQKKRAAVEEYYNALTNAYDDAGTVKQKEKLIAEMVRVATHHNKYSILPTVGNSIQVNGEKYQLNDKQQETYQRLYLALVMYGADHKDTAKLLGGKPINAKGKAVTGYAIHGLDDLLNTRKYRMATEEEKLKLIETVKRMANEVAKAKMMKGMR